MNKLEHQAGAQETIIQKQETEIQKLKAKVTPANPVAQGNSRRLRDLPKANSWSGVTA